MIVFFPRSKPQTHTHTHRRACTTVDSPPIFPNTASIQKDKPNANYKVTMRTLSPWNIYCLCLCFVYIFLKKNFIGIFSLLYIPSNKHRTKYFTVHHITSHRNIDDRLHGWLWIERRYLNVNISNVIIQILIL